MPGAHTTRTTPLPYSPFFLPCPHQWTPPPSLLTGWALPSRQDPPCPPLHRPSGQYPCPQHAPLPLCPRQAREELPTRTAHSTPPLLTPLAHDTPQLPGEHPCSPSPCRDPCCPGGGEEGDVPRRVHNTFPDDTPSIFPLYLFPCLLLA